MKTLGLSGFLIDQEKHLTSFAFSSLPLSACRSIDSFSFALSLLFYGGLEGFCRTGEKNCETK